MLVHRHSVDALAGSGRLEEDMAKPLSDLGRRERQIMEVLFRRGQATAAQVLADLPDPPSYSSVRTMLRLLEEKGHLRHKEQGRRFVYVPVVGPGKARR